MNTRWLRDAKLRIMTSDAVVAEVRRLAYSSIPDSEKLHRIQAAVRAVSIELRPDVRRLIEEIAKTHGVTLDEIMDIKRRHEAVVFARWNCWHALYVDFRLSYPEIGHIFNLSHSTVISGVKALQKKMVRDANTPATPTSSTPHPKPRPLAAGGSR